MSRTVELELPIWTTAAVIFWMTIRPVQHSTTGGVRRDSGVFPVWRRCDRNVRPTDAHIIFHLRTRRIRRRFLASSFLAWWVLSVVGQRLITRPSVSIESRGSKVLRSDYPVCLPSTSARHWMMSIEEFSNCSNAMHGTKLPSRWVMQSASLMGLSGIGSKISNRQVLSRGTCQLSIRRSRLSAPDPY